MKIVNIVLSVLWVPLFPFYGGLTALVFAMANDSGQMSALGQVFQMLGLVSAVVAVVCWILAIIFQFLKKYKLALFLQVLPLLYTGICVLVCLSGI